MKKLIVAAFAIATAVVVNAATVSWSATNVYAGNATDKASGIAYFMVSDTAYATLMAGGLDAAGVTTAIGSAYSYTPGTAGTYSVASTTPVANATLGLSDTTAYTGYLVIFDGATIADSTKYYISNTKDFETYGGTSNINVGFMSQKTASQNAANWHSMGEVVPEPSSGLLMLLGMAGLALRRRRA